MIDEFLIAVTDGNIEVVTGRLREDRSIVNRLFPSGDLPLNVACWQKNPEMVNTLLAFGANPHASDRDGQTALHFTMHETFSHDLSSAKEITLILLDLDVDVNAFNNRLYSPLMVLAELQDEDVFELADLLIKCGATVDIYSAVWLQRVDDVKRLWPLERDRLSNNWKRELLYSAQTNENSEIVSILTGKEGTATTDDDASPDDDSSK